MYESKIKEIAKDNKYTKWYLNIVSNAKSRIHTDVKRHRIKEARELLGYSESHHLYPNCLCDKKESLDKDNIVHLSAREHYVCHWLLCKMFEGELKHKMQYGFSMFMQSTNRHKRNLSSRDFETIKRQLSEAAAESARKRFTGVKKSPEQIAKMKEAWKTRERGISLTEEHKLKISNSIKGRTPSIETRKKLSEALKGFKMTDEQKKKMSEIAKLKTGDKNAMFGRRKYIHPVTLDRKMFVIGTEDYGYVLVKAWQKTQLKGQNGMSSEENRAKVAASKIGRKLATNPITKERKYVFPDRIPEGFFIG